MRQAQTAARLAAAGCIAPDEEAALLLADTPSDHDLAARVTRRAAGEPLEHIVGWARFAGRRVAVSPGVFVPRPRSEALVTRAASALAAATPPQIAVDLCTGSGALAVVLAAAVPGARVLAVDDDPAALRDARRNGAPLGVEVLQGDLDAPLPPEVRGAVAVLTAIVPYVPSDEVPYLPAEAREHEPRRALDGGPDGLDVLRHVAAVAPSLLRPGGRVLLELAAHQAMPATTILRQVGLAAVTVGRDEEDEITFVEGSAPGA